MKHFEQKISSYLDALFESLCENKNQDGFNQKMNDFISFTKKYLNLEKVPQIEFLEEKEDGMTSAAYDSKEESIKVIRGNRAFFDICRSVAHELVHRSQHEKVQDASLIDSEAGSKDEDEANAVAGEIIRLYGDENDWFYEE